MGNQQPIYDPSAATGPPPGRGPARTGEWTAPTYSTSRPTQIDYRQAERNHCLIGDETGPAVDSLHILRTQMLRRTRERDWRTVMVTSVRPGEGKTVTAINLAFAMAREYHQTVALVDGDFRKPSVCRYLGIESSRGLVDYFLDGVPLQEIILWPGVEKLTLIPGGDRSRARPKSSAHPA